MRLLITGASGMLGSDLVTRAKALGEVLAPTHADLDITDPESVAQLNVGTFGQLDWIINCVAYTAVDAAETNVRAATELNAIAPGYLARAAATSGAKFIHVSTDFVFDGTSNQPYAEDTKTHPLGVYGRTKREGEIAALEAHPQAIIVRTSWLFGPNGGSFPRTIIRAWEANKNLRVIDDQTGNPTYTAHLADTLVQMIEKNAYPGVYHATGPESMSWHQFAIRAIERWKAHTGDDRPINITPIPTSEWHTPAERPTYSVLSNEKLHALGIAPMPELDEALDDFCRRLSEP